MSEKCAVFTKHYKDMIEVGRDNCARKPYLKTRGNRKTMGMYLCYEHAQSILTPSQIKKASILGPPK